ncbi:unnamed protein product [Hermetia illucens]|uniref:Lipase domain-containing protein n=2 Tax=Hermetia illucens TaxID=343691 RepID=A0A7R8UF45_HERIL|nr:unnamed protein product [Hermetia illucens]
MIVFLVVIPNLHAVNISVGSCLVQVNEMCNSEFIRFYLSSSMRPRSEAILLDNQKPELPDWAPVGNNLKVLIHGYAGGIKKNQMKAVEDAYLKRRNTNIITVDWGKLALLPCYPTAVINTKHAGDCLSKFLMKIQHHHPSFNIHQIHLVGISLGAHVAGFAGNHIERTSGKKVDRITGLDAALPLFANPNVNMKLDASDANFVDVIHTNMGIFGKMEPSGHVDFYVNGGYLQPACNNSMNTPLCSHMMSTIYFAESVHSKFGFWGIRCPSIFQFIFGQCEVGTSIQESDKVLMGEHCPQGQHGIVLIRTNKKQPFALGRNGALKIVREEMYPENGFYGTLRYLRSLF